MIVIDPEFKDLIPPLSSEEFQQLEENCVRDGIRDRLVVWPQENGTDILIDGHNRWEIIGKHINLLEPSFERIEFKDRNEAKEWIIRNQLGRRNIPPFVRAELALKLKPMIAEKAKERMLNPMQNSAQGTTRDKLAKAAGVSHDTINKVEKIQEKASEETKQALRRGETSINQAYKGIIEAEYEDKYQEKARELREAKRRAEEYEPDKVVQIGEAKQHADDNKLILGEFKDLVYKAFTAVNTLAINADKDVYAKPIKTASPEEQEEIRKDLTYATKALMGVKIRIMEVLSEK